MLFVQAFLALILGTGPLLVPNDGAAEVALGGIQLRNERRIAMRKERLFISKGLVHVEYEFVNESDQDIVTEIAFPIPDYFCDRGIGYQPFTYFAVWVNDQHVRHQTEVKALFKGKDVSEQLRQLGLNIETFGLWTETGGANGPVSQMDILPPEKRQALITQGIIEAGDFWPQWTVRKTYHWTQKFPAKAVTRITHNYTPVPGDQFLSGDTPLDEKDFPGLCPDASFQKALAEARAKAAKAGQGGVTLSWVKYILTTANTWKGPIQDFELVVQRKPGERVSFCWEGPIRKTGPDTFTASAKNFRPARELTIYFLSE